MVVVEMYMLYKTLSQIFIFTTPLSSLSIQTLDNQCFVGQCHQREELPNDRTDFFQEASLLRHKVI